MDVGATRECGACSQPRACSTDVARCIETIADACGHPLPGQDPLQFCDTIDDARRGECQERCRASMLSAHFRRTVAECVRTATRQSRPIGPLGLTEPGYTTMDCEAACREELQREGRNFASPSAGVVDQRPVPREMPEKSP